MRRKPSLNGSRNLYLAVRAMYWELDVADTGATKFANILAALKACEQRRNAAHLANIEERQRRHQQGGNQ